jgi:AmpD protein
MRVDAAGVLPGVRFVASPNHDERPAGEAVVLVVLHGISLPPGRFGGSDIERLFTNTLDPAADAYYAGLAELRVSAHFVVRRRGEIVQFVACERRAWHAGASQWNGRSRCNDFSVGIELEGADEVPYAAAQYRAVAKLVAALQVRYPIAAIVGHSDVAPGRKTDPGPAFDWPRFRAQLARCR